jgi:manganese/zinc/iron transport system substrate-binding protein
MKLSNAIGNIGKIVRLAALVVLAGCASDTARDPAPSRGAAAIGDRPVRVTTTTMMIADIVKNVGGERVQVERLMGPGVDPHLYKATQADLEKLSGCDIIFYNGLHLEGKMVDIFVKMARTRPVVAVTEDVPQAELREPPEFQGNFDPHIWFDVSLWRRAAETVLDRLKEIDPAHAATYDRNAVDYLARLQDLDGWCEERLKEVPREKRVLVTAHDAFGYFGRAYDVEVLGLQGISTVAEYGLQDLSRMVDLLVERKIGAVFVESSVPQRSIEALVKGCQERGHAIRIGGELFSDAMGADGTPEGTYIGMVRHNVDTIVEALK